MPIVPASVIQGRNPALHGSDLRVPATALAQLVEPRQCQEPPRTRIPPDRRLGLSKCRVKVLPQLTAIRKSAVDDLDIDLERLDQIRRSNKIRRRLVRPASACGVQERYHRLQAANIE